MWRCTSQICFVRHRTYIISVRAYNKRSYIYTALAKHIRSMSHSLHFSAFIWLSMSLFLSHLVNSQTVHANATVGWTDNPTTRGTLDIMFSCFFTIFACTWSVLHPNVPHPSMGSITRLRNKVGETILTILIPESTFLDAISFRRDNHQQFLGFAAHANENNSNNSNTHDFMGG